MNGEEKWKPIAEFEETYEVSDRHRVRSQYVPRGRGKLGVVWRILKQTLDDYGRPVVTLYLRGKRRHFRVSHLVADAFLPPKSSDDQVLRHLNDDPTDNRLENLAWGTYSDNMADSIRNGKFRTSKGNANGMAKLTEDNVREIRRLYATGNFTQRELALRFGVSHATIGRIVRREIWKHVV